MPQTTDYSKGPFDFVSAVESGIQGEWEKMGQQSLSGLTFAMYAAGRYHTRGQVKEAWGHELKILWWAFVYIESLQLLFIGASSCGSQYGTAAERFDDADYALSNASVTSSWTGNAADAYNDQNDQQRARVQQMSSLDTEIAAILATESDQVDRHYQSLAEIRTIVQSFIVICMTLNASGHPVASLNIQKSVATLAYASGTAIALWMINDSAKNSTEIKTRIADYQALADGAAASLAQLTGATGEVNVATGRKSFVGEFDKLTNVAGLDAATTMAPDMPTPARVSGSADKRFAPSFPGTGDGGSLGEDLAAARSEHKGKAPKSEFTPAYTTPTMGQEMGRAQASTQAAKGSMARSGSAGPAEVVSDQARAESAAFVEGLHAEDVEGAAAGPEDAKRAPIDVGAGGAEQVQRPTGRTV